MAVTKYLQFPSPSRLRSPGTALEDETRALDWVLKRLEWLNTETNPMNPKSISPLRISKIAQCLILISSQILWHRDLSKICFHRTDKNTSCEVAWKAAPICSTCKLLITLIVGDEKNGLFLAKSSDKVVAINPISNKYLFEAIVKAKYQQNTGEMQVTILSHFVVKKPNWPLIKPSGLKNQ